EAVSQRETSRAIRGAGSASLPPSGETTMNCSRCGTLQTPGSTQCPRCGLPLSQPLEDNAMMRMILPIGRSWVAIVAGYLGLLAFTVYPAPLALVVGILAVWHIKKNPGKHGMGRAIFAIVTGTLGTVVLALVFSAKR